MNQFIDVIDAILALADAKQPLFTEDEERLKELDRRFNLLRHQGGFPEVDPCPVYCDPLPRFPGCRLPFTADNSNGHSITVYPSQDWRAGMQLVRDLVETSDSPKRSEAPTRLKSKRGPKVKHDPKSDQRVADAWKSGTHVDFLGLANALGMTRKDVKQAIDRHRKRTTE